MQDSAPDEQGYTKHSHTQSILDLFTVLSPLALRLAIFGGVTVLKGPSCITFVPIFNKTVPTKTQTMHLSLYTTYSPKFYLNKRQCKSN